MIENNLQQAVANALKSLYGIEAAPGTVVLQATKKEFEGDYTVVVFPYVKQARKSPEQVGNELGAEVSKAVAEVSGYNVIKGFLNFSVSDSYWAEFVDSKAGDASYGLRKALPDAKPVVVEYSSPNTN